MNYCKYCSKSFTNNVNFCSDCGKSLKKVNNDKSQTLSSIIGFYILVLSFIGISGFIFDKFPQNLWVELIVEVLFIAIVLGFCSSNLKEILPLYKFPKIKRGLYLKYIPFICLFSVSVYFLVNELNSLIFPNQYINIVSDYIYLNNTFLWAFIFVAILPPIFEELAFRGILYNQLSKITSLESTIIATSMLFALVHFSFISIIWIFPFGLLLGYLRNKYNSLWIPMLVHFIHNFIVLILDYYFHFKEVLFAS
ncbi:Membrane protease YdiL (CAAX protease family) [Tenacibaculum sp. 190524A05c]|uniref:CPBP family intramembrane glutamic endopeptidase n=1 Tax=Tenacibaculum platacis TaxID=3137852 RepID=UPI0031FA798B